MFFPKTGVFFFYKQSHSPERWEVTENSKIQTKGRAGDENLMASLYTRQEDAENT